MATRGTDLSQRLLALGGLVAIVGIVIGVLLVAGLLGNQGGGKGIKEVALLEPPRSADQADLRVGPQIGRLAPGFEISDFDGTRHRLSDFRGKAVYINFWATWCVPCTIELPDIETLEQRHKDEITVIAVNRRESLDNARPYFERIPLKDGGTGVSFSVNGMDPNDTLYDEYQGGPGMPVSVFIDSNGVVTGLSRGIISLEAMEAAVAEALAGAPAGDS